jgi:hypothetical protein
MDEREIFKIAACFHNNSAEELNKQALVAILKTVFHFNHIVAKRISPFPEHIQWN